MQKRCTVVGGVGESMVKYGGGLHSTWSVPAERRTEVGVIATIPLTQTNKSNTSSADIR